jgi:hypothetical protein
VVRKATDLNQIAGLPKEKTMFVLVLSHLALAVQVAAIGYVTLRTVKDRGAGW